MKRFWEGLGSALVILLILGIGSALDIVFRFLATWTGSIWWHMIFVGYDDSFGLVFVFGLFFFCFFLLPSIKSKKSDPEWYGWTKKLFLRLLWGR